MRCIEILIFPPIFKKYFMININMRCIEIIIRHMLYYTKPRLTLTWDVLKWINPKDSDAMNLWLTLTWDVLKSNVSSLVPSFRLGININMRCIEIKLTEWQQTDCRRLTLTWDVLKLSSIGTLLLSAMGLTLTWDVLKL